MTIITQHENPAEYAPSIFFNHCGSMPWSGRHVAAFNGLELVELFQFCEKEGHRQGRNDANQDRVGTREEAPFHQDFMGGYPKQLWENAYWCGVQEYGDLRPELIEQDIQNVLNDQATSHWLRDALASAIPRDCIDALSDAECLSNLLTRRYNAIAMGGADPATDEALF